ncbi:hypothetical protein BGP_4560 [Beggiatoa sp. PS]|nr:hypothetical protein BGP_4560 [Beggiatoa sp. PS]
MNEVGFKKRITQSFYALLMTLLLLPNVYAFFDIVLPDGITIPFTPVDSQLSFDISKSHYRIGEKLEVNLVENLNELHHREMRVDLWIAIVRPNGDKLFVKNHPFDKFSSEPQRFNQLPIEVSELTHRVMDFEVSSGFGGNYTFYAVYVAQSTNPMEDFTVIRSNVAMIEVSLDNRPDVVLYPSDEELPVYDIPDPFALDFTGVKSVYPVGDQVQIDSVEKLALVQSSFHRVDLWVAIVLPDGQKLFLSNDPFNKFGGPQPFKKSLSGIDNKTHRVLDFVVPPGFGGNYSFHSVYVEEGKSPMEDFTAIRSNVARVQMMLNDR